MSRNNRILFAGDPHGDFQSLIDAAIENRPDAVVLLG
ncbi:MAG TPA: metallophosphoesterase, partial [Methylococcaceae bacterium]|nr:metallophosphoesterase [Methylococcaceae bacterium]